MSIFTDQTSAFTPTLGGLYSCVGTFDVTFPAITSADQGAVIIANQGTGIITVKPTGSDTVKKKVTYPLNAGQFVLFVSDQASNWVPLTSSKNTEISILVPMGASASFSTSNTAAAFLNSFMIGTPADFGFPWATVITATAYYWVSTGNATATATATLYTTNLSTGVQTEVTGASAATTSTTPTKLTASVISLSQNTQYLVALRSSSALFAANLYGAVIVLSFS